VDGIQFAFGIVESDARFWHIYEWRPISDSRVWVAQSLQQHVEWQLGTSQAE
jgi:hypothetical protein